MCKDEDEVVVRPLQFAEQKARLLNGRDQITPDGRHLYDGLPFGRPLLRGVTRPDVRIPPAVRERAEVEYEDNVAGASDVVPFESDQQLPTLEMGKAAEREIERMMASGQLTRKEEGIWAAIRDMGMLDEDDERNGDAEAKLIKAIMGAEPAEREGEDGDDDEDDGDFAPGVEEEDEEEDVEELTSASDVSSSSEDESEDSSVVSSDSGSSDSTSDSDSDSGSSSSEASWNGVQSDASQLKTAKAKSGEAAMINGTSSLPNGQSGTLKRKHQTDDAEAGPQKKPHTMDSSPYHEGKSQTKSRNERRRSAKRLQYLKNNGILPQDADLEALRAYDRTEGTACEGQGAAERTTAQRKKDAEKVALETQRQQLLAAIASGGVDVTHADQGSKQPLAGEETRLTPSDEPPEEMSSKQPLAANGVHASGEPSTQTESTPQLVEGTSEPDSTRLSETPSQPAVRRNKPDLAGMKRLLFGSLGVRVPKTQAEKDATQSKLSQRGKRNVPAASSMNGDGIGENTADEVESEDDENDSEAWRKRLEIDAVECSDENVVLSAPPFPFQQRWDPQYKRKRSKKQASNENLALRKRRKHDNWANASEVEHSESYDKYNTNGNGDALDYDDVAEDEEYWEEGALLEEEDYDAFEESDPAVQQLLSETADAARVAEPDFPTVPESLETLPTITEGEAKINSVVVYTELTCSLATDWQPKVLHRTAQLLGKDGDEWTILLAVRDIDPKTYDDEGNRVYSKFEMEGLSDDGEGEEDERKRVVKWADLGEVRLLAETWEAPKE